VRRYAAIRTCRRQRAGSRYEGAQARGLVVDTGVVRQPTLGRLVFCFGFGVASVIGVAVASGHHASWIRVGLWLLPAIPFVGLTLRAFSKLPHPRTLVVVARLVVFGFPVFWAYCLTIATTGSWVWSAVAALSAFTVVGEAIGHVRRTRRQTQIEAQRHGPWQPFTGEDAELCRSLIVSVITADLAGFDRTYSDAQLLSDEKHRAVLIALSGAIARSALAGRVLTVRRSDTRRDELMSQLASGVFRDRVDSTHAEVVAHRLYRREAEPLLPTDDQILTTHLVVTAMVISRLSRSFFAADWYTRLEAATRSAQGSLGISEAALQSLNAKS
jgi:hypothetical protein